jgi:nucleotide-binding universal stress UspA family protein
MKKILILTDFSGPSKNAGKYAISLASAYNSEIIIANAFFVPSEAKMATRVVWPLVDYATLSRESYSDLERFSKTLIKSDKHEADKVESNIELESRPGSILEVSSELVLEKQIDLVIMGMVGAGFLPQLIFGSNCRTMIAKATFPVLYIPDGVRFKVIKTIAFATDMDFGDIKVIKAIVGLLGRPHIQIRLIHISKKEISPASNKAVHIEVFLKDVKENISNINVTYDEVSDIDVEDGLQWLTAEFKIDVLAMVHRQHSFISRLFQGSHTQRISRLAEIPLLVLPFK